MRIREANEGDINDIFAWRNDETSRLMSINSAKVSLQEHRAWFMSVVANPARKLYIGFDGLNKFGMVRFDLEHKTNKVDVSINLNPAFRGRGMGLALLSEAVKTYQVAEARVLVAKIKKENVASLKIFERCNFSRRQGDGRVITLERQEQET